MFCVVPLLLDPLKVVDQHFAVVILFELFPIHILVVQRPNAVNYAWFPSLSRWPNERYWRLHGRRHLRERQRNWVEKATEKSKDKKKAGRHGKY